MRERWPNVRVHRQLEKSALVVGDVELAQEDRERASGRRVWPHAV